MLTYVPDARNFYGTGAPRGGSAFYGGGEPIPRQEGCLNLGSCENRRKHRIA